MMTLPVPLETVEASQRGRAVLGACGFLVMLGMWGTYNSLGVLLKPMSATQGWSRSEFSGSVGLATIAFGFSSLLMGRLVDRMGIQPVLTASCIGMSGGLLLASQSAALWQLYVSLLIVGIALGGAYVPLMATGVRLYPRSAGFFAAVLFLGVGLAGAVGPLVTQALVDHLGWRTAIATLAAASLCVTVPVSLVAASVARASPVNSRAPAAAKTNPAPNPLRQRAFWALAVAWSGQGMIWTAVLVHSVPLMTDRGIGVPSASAVLALMYLASTIGGLAAGLAVDHAGGRRVILPLLVLVTAAQVPYLIAGDVSIFALASVTFGFGAGGLATAVPSAIREVLPATGLGAALGVLEVCWALSASVGPVVGGLFFDATGGYGAALLFFGIVGLAARLGVSLLWRSPVGPAGWRPAPLEM